MKTARRHLPLPTRGDLTHCHGKPTRPHVLEVRLSAVAGMLAGPPCHESPRVPWVCNHELHCAACGKVTRATLGRECPDR